MKFIVSLRNPAARAYSHWNMEHARGNERRSFQDAIVAEAAALAADAPQDRVRSYLDRGFYARQLARLWTWFPRDQVLVLRSEQVSGQPQVTMDRICQFLGIDRLPNVSARREHHRAYPAAMRMEDWAFMQDLFEPGIRDLERLLDWDCTDWRQDPRTAGLATA
jgi:hypothetical protein